MRRKTKKPADPRLQRVLDVLDEISDYNCSYSDPDAPDTDAVAIEIITAALRGMGAVEIERMQQVIALLWADNDQDTYSDEEERRAAMFAVAERVHRIACDCCRKRHEEAKAAMAALMPKQEATVIQ